MESSKSEKHQSSLKESDGSHKQILTISDKKKLSSRSSSKSSEKSHKKSHKKKHKKNREQRDFNPIQSTVYFGFNAPKPYSN